MSVKVQSGSRRAARRRAEEQRLMTRLGRMVELREGEVLLRPGDALEGVWVVLEGSCMRTQGTRMDGTTRQVLRRRAAFGQVTPGRSERCRERIQALEHTTLVHLDPPGLQALMMEDLGFGTGLLQSVGETRQAVGAREDAAPSPSARVVAVHGPRGGAGTTTAAITLAAQAATLDARVLVVDAHRYLGSVAPVCDMKPAEDLGTLCGAVPDVEELLEAVRTTGPFDLLAAPRCLEHGDLVDPTSLEEILRRLRSHYDLIVIDLPPGVDTLSVHCLGLSDDVLMVVPGDYAGLVTASRFLLALEQLGVDSEVVHVLFNRFREEGGITAQTLSESLGRSCRVVPADEGSIQALTNRGELHRIAFRLAGDPLVRALGDLARYLLLPMYRRRGWKPQPEDAAEGDSLGALAAGFAMTQVIGWVVFGAILGL